MTRGRKILYGCLIVMGAAVVFVVVVFFLFARWLQTPTEPLEALRLVDDDTGVYIEVTLREDDPGARDLVRELFLVNQRMQRLQTELPPFMSWMNNLNQQQISDEDLDELLPLAAVISLQTGSSDAAAASFVVDLPSAGNSLKLFDRFFGFAARRSSELGYTEYLGDQYYRLPMDHTEADLWACIVETHLAFALQEPAIRSVVERMARTAEERAGSHPRMMALLDEHPPGSVVRLASVDATDDLLALVDRPFPELSTFLGGLVGDGRLVSVWLQIESPGTLVGEIHADAGLSAGESVLAPRVGDVVRLDLHGGRLQVALEPIRASRTGWSAWRLRVDGLMNTIRFAIEDAATNRDGDR